MLNLKSLQSNTFDKLFSERIPNANQSVKNYSITFIIQCRWKIIRFAVYIQHSVELRFIVESSQSSNGDGDYFLRMRLQGKGGLVWWYLFIWFFQRNCALWNYCNCRCSHRAPITATSTINTKSMESHMVWMCRRFHQVSRLLKEVK